MTIYCNTMATSLLIPPLSGFKPIITVICQLVFTLSLIIYFCQAIPCLSFLQRYKNSLDLKWTTPLQLLTRLVVMHMESPRAMSWRAPAIRAGQPGMRSRVWAHSQYLEQGHQTSLSSLPLRSEKCPITPRYYHSNAVPSQFMLGRAVYTRFVCET